MLIQFNDGNRTLPQEFINNPSTIFYKSGINIKAGIPQFDENGFIKDDPGAVKNIPELDIVGKKINQNKGKIRKTGLIFYEPIIMEYLRCKDLPAPILVGISKNGDEAFFFTNKISGIHGRNILETNDCNLITKAGAMCEMLKEQYARFGIERKFEMKDMVFEINNSELARVIPTDFEKTKINPDLIDQKLMKEIIDQFNNFHF